MVRRRRRRSVMPNVERAPGPSGVLAELRGMHARIWRFPGWPANDNRPRGTPTIPEWPNADAYYHALERGEIQRS
jgi:hypothetical protein